MVLLTASYTMLWTSPHSSSGTLSYLTQVSICHFHCIFLGFPCDTNAKEPTCQCRNHRDVGSVPGMRRYPGEGQGNPLQYSSLRNPLDRGAWQATVHKESDITEATDHTLYNHKGFHLGHTWMASGFPFLLQSKSEFCNKELMIWETVSTQSFLSDCTEYSVQNVCVYRVWQRI